MSQEKLATLLPVVDFKGVKFRDISPLLMDFEMREFVCRQIALKFKDSRIDVVAGIEARGFLFGPIVANFLEVGFVSIRKPSKLPGKVLRHTYAKEYGTDTLEIPDGLLQQGSRVLIVDDILATGGTIIAAHSLINEAKAIPVACAVVGEIESLKGREKITTECFHYEYKCVVDSTGFPCSGACKVPTEVYSCIAF